MVEAMMTKKIKTTNITPICVKYGKKPSHFLDNPSIIDLISTYNWVVNITRGRNGGTHIDDRLLAEFYLWLSPETRNMVINGKLP